MLSIYEAKDASNVTQTEVPLYGSSRLGIWRANRNATDCGEQPDLVTAQYTGHKRYELSDHLGNVLALISDKKLEHNWTGGTTVDQWLPDVVEARDYYAFGGDIVGRSYNPTGQAGRYGFNGKEDDEAVGSSVYDYGFRIYNPALGKFLSVDPLTENYPWYTPYQFAGNKPIWCVDLDGLEEKLPVPYRTMPVQSNVSESTCINCAQQQLLVHRVKAASSLEKLTDEYIAWRRDVNNFGKPVPPQFTQIAPQSQTQSTIQQGGVMGSRQWQIAKSRMDLYGDYLPGISDVNDGLDFVAAVKNAQYKRAAFTALFFLPGGDFLKPLKLLKGAGKLGGSACMDYAGAFMKKYSKKISEAGGNVKHMEINMGSGNIGAGIHPESINLSNTGKHQFVEVTDASGAVKIFDNAHPEGILKADFLKSIAGANTRDGFMEGVDLYKKYAKEIKH